VSPRDGGGWCVTANLEKGNAAGVRPWLSETLQSSPMLVFLQEFKHREFLETLAAERGYRVIWPPQVDPKWWVVSSILVRDDIEASPPDDETAALLRSFDSYTAAAHVVLPELGEVTAVSVHASPRRSRRQVDRWGCRRGAVVRPRSGLVPAVTSTTRDCRCARRATQRTLADP
jgi:hypothetical protein